MDIATIVSVVTLIGMPVLGIWLDWEQDRVHNRKGTDPKYNKYLESLKKSS